MFILRYKLSRPKFRMASSVKVTDLVRMYNGDGDVVEWLNKFELVVTLRDIKEPATVVPLFLEGSAFSIYNELSDSHKKSYESIKKALIEAFSLNPFQAYEQLTKRVWCDESVDVYLADLRKLARLAGVSSDTLLIRAFIVGLPSVVSRELRAVSKIDSLSLKDIVDRARSLMAELVEKPVIAVAAQHVEPDKSKAPNRRCFRCGGPHLIKYCKSQSNRPIICWTCGQEGHITKNCTSGNEFRRVCAPATLQEQE